MMRLLQPIPSPTAGIAGATALGVGYAWLTTENLVLLVIIGFFAWFLEWSIARRFKPLDEFLAHMRKDEQSRVDAEEKARVREESIDTALKLAVAGRVADRDAIAELRVNDARQQAQLDQIAADVRSLKTPRFTGSGR